MINIEKVVNGYVISVSTGGGAYTYVASNEEEMLKRVKFLLGEM